MEDVFFTVVGASHQIDFVVYIVETQFGVGNIRFFDIIGINVAAVVSCLIAFPRPGVRVVT